MLSISKWSVFFIDCKVNQILNTTGKILWTDILQVFSQDCLQEPLAGSVVALLYAPDKGSNTRDKISYKLQSLLEELNETIDKLQEGELSRNDSESEANR